VITAISRNASIARLGFHIKDVKVLLNSEPHADHGGGLAVLQQASGAKGWARRERRRLDLRRRRSRHGAADQGPRLASRPFIDPEGYRAYIDAAERDFRNGRVH